MIYIDICVLTPCHFADGYELDGALRQIAVGRHDVDALQHGVRFEISSTIAYSYLIYNSKTYHILDVG